MMNRKLEIDYIEYDSLDELEPQDKELCEAAERALKGSYAPYSHFNVGAAVRLALSQGPTRRIPPIRQDFAPNARRCSPLMRTTRAHR